MRYEDFTIWVMSKSEDGYEVTVNSPAGDDNETIKLPFEVEEGLAKLGAIGGTLRSLRTMEFPDDDSISPLEQGKTLGKQLHDALFTGKVGKLYQGSAARLSDDPEVGLRIKLRLNPEDPEVSKLAQLPWEYIYESDSGDYFSLNRQTPIVRYVEVPRPLSQPTLPVELRILVIMSNPEGVASLDLDKERQLIEDNWANDDKVKVDFLPNATVDSLRNALMNEQYHVLHYMGHGSYDDNKGSGALIFEDENQQAVKVDGQVLGMLLQGSPTVRLVFLNACDTAKAAEDHPFSGVANRLVLSGVPAVLAMQLPITDKAAIAFAKVFYQRLVDGFGVDEATAQGRRAVMTAETESMEWGTPVLYMRAPDGQLFVRGEDTPDPIPAPPPTPPSPVPSPDPSPSMLPKILAAAAACLVLAAAAWFFLKPSMTVQVQPDPIQLEVGIEKPLTIKLLDSKDRVLPATGKYTFKMEFAESAPLEIVQHPAPGSREWTIKATDLYESEEAAQLIIISFKPAGAKDEKYESHSFNVDISVNEETAKAYTESMEAIGNSKIDTAQLASNLARLESQKDRLSSSQSTELGRQLTALEALREQREKSSQISSDTQQLLSTRIQSLLTWKELFDTTRYPLGAENREPTSDSEQQSLMERLLDYQSRGNPERLLLCNDHRCNETQSRTRKKTDLFIKAIPAVAGLKCRSQRYNGQENRSCTDILNKTRSRFLNDTGEYEVEIRNSEGDLVLRQKIESY